MKLLDQFGYYSRRVWQTARQKGLRAVLQSVRARLRARLYKPPDALTVQDGLSFYRHRTEISWNPGTHKDLPKISILILTYNNLPISELCLRSIYCNTTYPNFEVIVVDNASADGTPAWLKTYAETHPNLRVFLNSDNRGFAGGNNQAAHEAQGEYVIFLNNDTIVTEGWVERLLAHIQSDAKLGLVGPVTNATGNEARIPVTYTTPTGMESFAAERARLMTMQSFDIRTLAFYCVMARKDQFEALGGLDERYKVGMFEDEDLAIRYQQQGLRVMCAEDVFIHHFFRTSFGKLDEEKYTQLFEENRRKFEEKWGHPWEPYALRQDSPPVKAGNGPILLSEPWGILYYRCNICGRPCKTPVADLGRETPSCVCGSTVRTRAIVHLLSMELFGRSLALPDFPGRPDLHGWGMSDGVFPALLSQKVGYINTFYDQEPRFDVTASLDPALEHTLDFLISSEVFEHVAPHVSIAFENARRLLKPTGVLILTVPYTLDSSTREHFPELYQYELLDRNGDLPVLKNVTQDGREQVFDNLVFHVGPGSTLEMRVFAETGLLAELERAGFGTIKICAEPCWEFGIYWRDRWSLPILAHPHR